MMILPEKETYEKGETIIYKNYDLTDSDKEVIKNKNNYCYYHFYGKLPLLFSFLWKIIWANYE